MGRGRLTTEQIEPGEFDSFFQTFNLNLEKQTDKFHIHTCLNIKLRVQTDRDTLKCKKKMSKWSVEKCRL